MQHPYSRRQFMRGSAVVGGSLALSSYFPAWAQPVSAGITAPLPTVSGNDITLRIARQTMMVDGRSSPAIGINGTVPAPLIRLREGQNVKLNVINDLAEDSSIHWHGLLVPPQFDGVPGVSFPESGVVQVICTSSRFGRMAPTGTIAIPVCRSSLATMARS